MDAVRRLKAVACDGYRSACSRARICDRLRLMIFSFLSFCYFATLPSGFFEFPMMDFYFVISKNDSQGDVFGRGFLVSYWVD